MSFDSVLAVDWSAASVPRRAGPDAIWTALARPGEAPPRPVHHPTRGEAEAWIAGALAGERAAGRRALAVLDVSFGLPEGAAAALGLGGPLDLWDLVEAGLTDAPSGANDRFAFAAGLNARLPGEGPFWGRPASMDLPGLPPRRPAAPAFPALRATERALAAHGGAAGRPKSVWQLAGAGAVGGQSLTAMPMLARLRRAGARAWPFEAAEGPAVLAETYFALWGEAAQPVGGEPRDAAQVRAAAAGLARMAGAGALGALLEVPEGMIAAAASEGWVLGAGHAGALERAAREALGR